MWTCPDDRTAGDKPQQNFFSGRKDVLDIFLREFDAAYEAGGLFQLTMHPHIITPRSRIWILDEVIRHANVQDAVRSIGQNVNVTTCHTDILQDVDGRDKPGHDEIKRLNG